MWLGFDIGLGPAADQPLSVWQESFVPMRLADALREVDGSNGQPLVLAEEQILPHRIAPEPAETPRPWWPWALAGLARSEEHTSELQSLMRISYAVFCLEKKKTT